MNSNNYNLYSVQFIFSENYVSWIMYQLSLNRYDFTFTNCCAYIENEQIIYDTRECSITAMVINQLKSF